MRRIALCVCVQSLLLVAGCRGPSPNPSAGSPDTARDHASAILFREDIFEKAPFAQCHASTIVDTGSGLVAAWFGGSAEGAADVGIWLARCEGGRWTSPLEVASGRAAGGVSEPCWNPVLFRPAGGPLLLFYKVGPSPSRWRGMLTRSADGGRTWAAPEALPEGITGPVKNRPIGLADGTILCGSSTESDGWRVHFETTKDMGATWARTDLLNDGKTLGLIQPALLRAGADGIIALMRSDAGRIYESRSADRLP
jgi:predicted neuraminidase